jgi:hypothetical protein
MAVSLTGDVGQVKYLYRVAADIEGYSIARSPEHGLQLTGTVVRSDAFLLTQSPLVFSAPYAHGVLRWSITSHTVADGQLTAVLGPRME